MTLGGRRYFFRMGSWGLEWLIDNAFKGYNVEVLNKWWSRIPVHGSSHQPNHFKVMQSIGQQCYEDFLAVLMIYLFCWVLQGRLYMLFGGSEKKKREDEEKAGKPAGKQNVL